jgi:hypothetical protein
MDDRLRIALLIDADNASAATLQYVLSELDDLGVTNVRRAYGDWGRPHLQRWRDALLASAIQPIQQIAYASKGNASDMAMVVDAMDLLHTARFDAFALMSSDSDFTPLAMRLRAGNMQVYGFGKASTPVAFKSACSKFYHVDVSEESDTGALNAQAAVENDNGKVVAGSVAAKAPAVPLPIDPRRKRTTQELQADTELVGVLKRATIATADDDGWSHLGKMGNQLGFVTPKSYGYKSLKPLIVATGLFQVRTDGTHVKLQDSQAPKAKKKASKPQVQKKPG